jgi:hypothetical protein
MRPAASPSHPHNSVPILFLSIFPFCFFFSPESRGPSLRAELAAVAHGGMGDFPAASFQGGATVRLRRAPRGEKRHGTTGSPSRRSGRGGTGDGDALPRASSPVVAANSAEVCVCFLFFLIFPHFFLQNLLFFFLRIS